MHIVISNEVWFDGLFHLLNAVSFAALTSYFLKTVQEQPGSPHLAFAILTSANQALEVRRRLAESSLSVSLRLPVIRAGISNPAIVDSWTHRR